MSQTRDRWEQVGRTFAELGRRVGERYRDSASDDHEEVSDAVDRLVARLDRAFTSLGETLRDPESKQAVERAARSLGDAVAGTFEDVGERVRRRAGSPREPRG
jgi:hypothetical protein